VSSFFFIPLQARLHSNIVFTLRRFWAYVFSVHAFGYNSTEGEPIWMKSGALDESILHSRGVGPGRFWARSAEYQKTAGEPGEILFFFVR